VPNVLQLPCNWVYLKPQGFKCCYTKHLRIAFLRKHHFNITFTAPIHYSCHPNPLATTLPPTVLNRLTLLGLTLSSSRTLLLIHVNTEPVSTTSSTSLLAPVSRLLITTLALAKPTQNTSSHTFHQLI